MAARHICERRGGQLASEAMVVVRVMQTKQLLVWGGVRVACEERGQLLYALVDADKKVKQPVLAPA